MVEIIKNGMFFSTKCVPVEVNAGTPHVILLGNDPPDLAQSSADRWTHKDGTSSVCDWATDARLPAGSLRNAPNPPPRAAASGGLECRCLPLRVTGALRRLPRLRPANGWRRLRGVLCQRGGRSRRAALAKHKCNRWLGAHATRGFHALAAFPKRPPHAFFDEVGAAVRRLLRKTQTFVMMFTSRGHMTFLPEVRQFWRGLVQCQHTDTN